jgi:predicted NBD/HSP70 family sugar kinase
VGDDIGAGIIVEGTFYPGSSGRAGANIGEMRVSDDEDGFLKNKVTSGAIMRRMEKLCKKETFMPDNVRDIAIAASGGDTECLQVMDETGRYLGIAIANILACLDPELVIIGGGIAQAGSVLIDPIKNYLDTYHKELSKNTKVVQAKLGEEAFSIGAATFVLHRVFAAPREFKR